MDFWERGSGHPLELSELGDVRALKRHLHQTCGLPRFRQCLIHEGIILPDDAGLAARINLQLVALPVCSASDAQRSDFTSAAEEGLVLQVECMLNSRHDPNLRDVGGCPPLAVAAGQGYSGVVELLVEADADTELTCDEGRTALLWAAVNGETEAVRSLLQAAANVDHLSGNHGATALMEASEQGHTEVMRLLLEAGSQVNVAAFSDGATALADASMDGHTEAVRLLLQARANVELADLDGATPLFLASCEGHTDVVRVLLQASADKDTADGQGCTALVAASREGHLETVMLLLEASADKDLATEHGATPLHAASGRGHYAVAFAAAAQGRGRGDHRGWTALHVAAAHGCCATTRLLLEAAADTDAVGSGGRTALQLACWWSHRDIVQELLEARADKDAVDGDGMTAFDYAGQEVRLLLLPKSLEVPTICAPAPAHEFPPRACYHSPFLKGFRCFRVRDVRFRV